jgi:Ca-activated chloride channel family protein
MAVLTASLAAALFGLACSESADVAGDAVAPPATTATTIGDTKGPGVRGTTHAPPPANETGAAAGREPPALPSACTALFTKTGGAKRSFVESADDSGSMASPVLAREQLRAHRAPDPTTIRPAEFANYYHAGFSPPTSMDELLSVHAAGTRTGATAEVVVGVRALPALSPRPGLAVTLALDNSGSMAGAGLARERAVVRALAKKLVAGDEISILTWAVDGAVVLARHPVTGPDDPAVLAAADALRASGGSDLHAALTGAFDDARAHFAKGKINRVVLVSDGGANLGATDSAALADQAANADAERIYLTGVGTGPAGAYDDRLLDAITDAGRGAYVYVDGDDEVARVFGPRFDEVMLIAARSVRIQLDLPWYATIDGFDGEGYSANAEDIEPQHMAPNGEMALHQTLALCDAGAITEGDGISVTVSWDDGAGGRVQHPPVSLPMSSLAGPPTNELRKSALIAHYAAALSDEKGFGAVHAEAQALLATDAFASDPVVKEIDELVQLHPKYGSAGK